MTPDLIPRAAFRLPICAALTVFALAAGPARGQNHFTEFALTDPDLNSSPETDFWIASAAAADVDGDGDLDLLVAGYFVVYFQSVEERLTFYRNDGQVDASTWALTPIPVDAGGLVFSSADIAWGDYDNDGDPDALVAACGETALFRNVGGTLVRTSTPLPNYLEDTDFSTLDLHSVTWTDFDNDGDLDLLLPSVDSGAGFEPTKILRNDGAGSGDAWVFTDVAAALPATSNAVSAWADLDGDGDLDLLLANISPYGDAFTNVYRNDAGTMNLASSDLAFIRYGTADWGDVDGDGDLDIVYGGNMDLPDGTGETVVRILFGDGNGGYTPLDIVHEFQSPTEPWLDFNAVTWADYDSDGDMDLLVSGEWLGNGEIFGRSMVYANTNGTFAPAGDLPAPIGGNAGGAFTWFDIDGDGDLDYFVAGAYYVPNGNGLVEARTQLFRNDTPAANLVPNAPNGLTVTRPRPGEIRLAWLPGADDSTPTGSLTYDLDVTAAGGGSGVRKAIPEPGNVSTNTSWRLRGLDPGTYSWSVRALDTAFNASPVANGVFVVTGGPGTPFCFGDGSLATACPCANVGEAGRGCANSTNPSGALLATAGQLAPDTLVLTASGTPATALSLFWQGSASHPSGFVFGDGLRCATGTLKRIGSKPASDGVVSYPGPSDLRIRARSAALGDPIASGSTRVYQASYRDPNPTFCPVPQGNTWNATNGVSIVWP